MDKESILPRPVGEVISDIDQPEDMPITGKSAVIEIYPEFTPALYRVEENSHLWVLSWFHKANREILRVAPHRLNPEIGERGIFGIRSYGRPNPIGLSLVRLRKVEGNQLYVSGMDAIGGTPVLDIKPYFEQDIVFSPQNPYFRPARSEVRRDMFLKEALNHHQEECLWLHTGVKLALIADEHFGKIQSPDLKVRVMGPGCLADVIQGLTRARFSNPPRFEYTPDAGMAAILWANADKTMRVRLRHLPEGDKVNLWEDDGLFDIQT